MIVVHGTVRRESIEGGFWMLEGYDVTNLPAEFRVDGLRVTAGLLPMPDAISFHMKGVIARVVWIRRGE